MGLFSQRKASVSTKLKNALRDADEPCSFESLESRQLLSLVIDLRLPGGGKVANVTGTGQVINMEVWAISSGSNSTGSDDGFQTLIGSFKSASGGSAKGDLSATLTDQFSGMSAFAGNTVDLDGDGDRDIGSNNDSTSDGFFVARSGGMSYTGGTVSGGSNSFKIADLNFKVTGVGSAGDTQVNFVPRGGDNGVAVWAEEAGIDEGVGSPILLRVASDTSGGGGGGGTPTIDASVSSGLLVVKGTSGNNNIKLTLSGTNIVANVDGKTKSFAASSVNKIKVYGLDGDDVLTVGAGVKATRLDGGNGNDSLVGGSFNDTLFAGAGRDTLKGGAGNDYLEGGTGADKILGGIGKDVASYFYRTKPVNVSIDERANDGEAGEGDNVRYDVEDIYGGKGNDFLRGDTDNNLLRGYDGRDTLIGGAGNDSLNGGNGVDKLSGESGNDKFYARDGSIDSLYGGAGKDRAQVDKNDIRKDIESLFA